ncbi:MAG: hypothetical protein ICV63_08560 [Coleofasciculus sp. Co-bin14]|nr:hypothetical protein [Coleofasciculus sp. Co-bin14]
MQNPQTERYTPPTSTNKHSASVPISVYRELAGELQSTQAQLETLKAQNQQLVKQNQQLRQEVEKVVQSAQHLQQLVYSLGSVSGVEVPNSRPFTPPEPRAVPSTPPPRTTTSAPNVEFPPHPQPSEPRSSPYAETVVIEQEDTRSRRTSASEGLSDVSGWLLIVAILLIVLTAFGTGFLIVRPLLKNSR